MEKRDIVILGGGISGLSAAWYLRNSGKDVLLLSADEGKMGSFETSGVVIEKGPRVFKTTRSRALLEMIEESEFKHQLIPSNPKAERRFIWKDGKMKQLSMIPAIKSLLFHEWRASRYAEDETIYQFSLRRFGLRVTSDLIDPFITGIYAGNIKELSIEGCFPELKNIERRGVSFLKAFLQAKKQKPLYHSSLFSFQHGTGSWIKHIQDSVNCHKNERVCSLIFEKKWIIETTKCTYIADQVISALPYYALQTVFPVVEEFYYQDITTVSLIWKEDLLALDGFGYLIPRSEQSSILGVLFDSKIFSKEGTMLTVMIEGVAHSEEKISQMVEEVVFKHLKIEKTADLSVVQTIYNAIPQPRVGHAERKKRLIEPFIEKQLYFIGNYLDGVSVSQCVELGKNAAQKCMKIN